MNIQKTKGWIFGIVFLSFCITGYTWGKFQFAGRESMIEFLKNAPAVSIQPDENAGRTEPWMVILNDGKAEQQAIFKHIDRTRPFPLADSYKYELAAYKLHRMLNLNFIPPTVSRTLNNRPGALQLYVEDCVPLIEAGKQGSVDVKKDPVRSRLRDIAVFDALTYCGCDQNEDILFQASSGHVCRVDYSQAFAPQKQLPPECRISGCSQDLLEKLKSISDADIRREMGSYLNLEEVNALLMRKHLLIEKIENI